MRLADLPSYVRDTALRMLPHRAHRGLVRVGRPGRGAPVLLTGNFTLTVRRLKDALAGRNVWLLCADSKGINVWCAAGGGYLTHHDVISVIRTSGIEALVDHREIVLPQLAATGVERRKITAATGWKTRWGPARLEDLPAYLDSGRRVLEAQRFMRFPLWERLEMAAVWLIPLLILSGAVIGWLWGWATLVAAAAAEVSVVAGLFVLLPWLRITGGTRWPTMASFASVGICVGAALLWTLGTASGTHLIVVAVTTVLCTLVVAIDLAGTTPWYGSSINTFHNQGHIEVVTDRCVGASDCVQVCPRDVLQMDSRRRKVKIARPQLCIQCGACIVQCPEDALRFRYDDGRIVDAPTIRSTRMNMVGRRTVAIRD